MNPVNPVQNEIINYLTIDVEDYFQVSAFEDIVGHEKWHEYPSRVENNTQKILDILAQHNTKATFFVLGWIAEKFPALIKEICGRRTNAKKIWLLSENIRRLTPGRCRSVSACKHLPIVDFKGGN